jgi:hypothetical protein
MIEEYLKQHNLNSKEDIAKHVEELKRNTFPDLELISSLCFYLFSPEKSGTNATRHKSRSGETHLEFPLLNELAKRGRVVMAFNRKGLPSEIIRLNSISEAEEFAKNNGFDEWKYLGDYCNEVNVNLVNESHNIGSILGGTTLYDTAKNQLLELSKGVKTNKNKPQISLLFKQFPEALKAIAKCSEYGHEKYKETDTDYLNFQRVEGGSKTYADASLRHRLEQGNDLESGLPHQYHVAWNALAELQMWIMENS